MKGWNYENEQWTKLPSYQKHLPLFTRHLDFTSTFFRILWAFILRQILFKYFIRLKVIGDYKKIYKENPRLLVISNHSSHLDATSIAASIPYRYWLDLYIAAAKDYFFSNPLFSFFSKHCLGAIPIDRKEKKGEAISLCLNLLTNLSRIWLIIFPEGTRSADGYLQDFKRGISIFSQKTKTPILFLYIDGSNRLWPKGQKFPHPGVMTVYIGPVHPPAPVEEINHAYKEWVVTINPNAYKEDSDKSDEGL